jgi:hypothetical protein
MHLFIPECPQCRSAKNVAQQVSYEGIGLDAARPHDKLQEFRCTQCGWAMVRISPRTADPPKPHAR